MLSAERVQYDGRDINRIKVMDDRGRVRVYMDDPRRSAADRSQRNTADDARLSVRQRCTATTCTPYLAHVSPAPPAITEYRMRILLVEDEAPLRETLAARLKREGFAVDAAQDGEEGLYMGREVPFDVGIIDLGLPKMSGMELVKALRDEGKQFPVLILTARSSWQDKVEGLKQGADDYLVKPFHVEELLARINALVRRAAGWSKPTLECGPVMLDLAAQTVSVNGGNVDLTSYEYKVLEYLMMHAGELVSKADLTEHIYQQDFDRDSNVLEVFIGRLRKKLDPDGALKPIETVRGRGYRFAIPRSGDMTARRDGAADARRDAIRRGAMPASDADGRQRNAAPGARVRCRRGNCWRRAWAWSRSSRWPASRWTARSSMSPARACATA